MKSNLDVNTYVENKLLNCNRKLGEYLASDVLFIKSAIQMGLDVAVRREVEEFSGLSY